MKKIILDTNFLLIPGQFKVDVFSEIHRICDFKYELCIVDKTIDELNKIINSKTKTKDKIAAKIALELIKRKKIKIISTKEKYVDDSLIDIVRTNESEVLIATQDTDLITRLRQYNTHIIRLRKKQFLELV